MYPINENTLRAARSTSNRILRFFAKLMPCSALVGPTAPTERRETPSISSVFSPVNSSLRHSPTADLFAAVEETTGEKAEEGETPVLSHHSSTHCGLMPPDETMEPHLRIQDLTADLAACRAHIHSLREQIFAADAAYEDLLGISGSRAGHIVQLTAMARAQERDIKQAKGKNWVFKEKARRLGRELERLEGEMATKNSRIEALKKENEELKRTVRRKKGLIGTLKWTRWGRNRNIRGLICSLFKRIGELEDEIRGMKTRGATREDQ